MSSRDQPPESRSRQAAATGTNEPRDAGVVRSAPLQAVSFARLIPVFKSQLLEAELRARRAQSEADNLRKVIEGLEGLTGNREQIPLFVQTERRREPSEPEGPRGQEAVRQVMNTDPDRVWPLSSIAHEILRRGWIDPVAKVPNAAIRAATQRLAAAGMAEKVGTGRYKLTDRGRAKGG